MTGTFDIGMTSDPPILKVGKANPEVFKYTKLWEMPQYRRSSPGENHVQTFLQEAQPVLGSHILDCGCGTGRASLLLSQMGFKVTMLDFARNCLDEEVRNELDSRRGRLDFKKCDLELPLPYVAEYAFCCDVMEHIPPDKVIPTIDNILRAAKWCYFSIAITEDSCGELIGETLHLSVHPFEWWEDLFKNKFGCKIKWSRSPHAEHAVLGDTFTPPNSALFLVSAWDDAQTVVDAGVVNETMERILANVRTNCAQGWQQIYPHQWNDLEVMILGGGPSLTQFESDIKQKRAEGVKLVTLNGSYNWCLDHGLVPSATVVIDAREFNARFTHPVVDNCKYLIASQCHPAVLDGLPKDRTYLWHAMGEVKEINDAIAEHYPINYKIPGGCTILLRAIPLLLTLGYNKFHLYGCDSCLMDRDGAHHAYSQPENDGQAVIPLMVTGGRIFYCHPWMVAQAQEFITLIKKIGEDFDMAVYGDGLLSHIITTGAELVGELDEEKEES